MHSKNIISLRLRGSSHKKTKTKQLHIVVLGHLSALICKISLYRFVHSCTSEWDFVLLNSKYQMFLLFLCLKKAIQMSLKFKVPPEDARMSKDIRKKQNGILKAQREQGKQSTAISAADSYFLIYFILKT